MKRILFPLISILLAHTILCAQLIIPVDDVRLVIGTGGFLGEKQIGFETNNFTFLFGRTEKSDQITVKYDYPLFEVITVGIFATYSLDDKMFFASPSRYPSRTYYEETALRFGLSLGLRYGIFYINTNILDSGFIIMYNEKSQRTLDNKYLWSTGFGISLPL